MIRLPDELCLNSVLYLTLLISVMRLTFHCFLAGKRGADASTVNLRSRSKLKCTTEAL
jgi:hypothetical protein